MDLPMDNMSINDLTALIHKAQQTITTKKREILNNAEYIKDVEKLYHLREVCRQGLRIKSTVNLPVEFCLSFTEYGYSGHLQQTIYNQHNVGELHRLESNPAYLDKFADHLEKINLYNKLFSETYEKYKGLVPFSVFWDDVRFGIR